MTFISLPVCRRRVRRSDRSGRITRKRELGRRALTGALKFRFPDGRNARCCSQGDLRGVVLMRRSGRWVYNRSFHESPERRAD
jgi:hypothetical protein